MLEGGAPRGKPVGEARRGSGGAVGTGPLLRFIVCVLNNNVIVQCPSFYLYYLVDI